MNITSLHQSLYRTPPGGDPLGTRTATSRIPAAPQTAPIPYAERDADVVAAQRTQVGVASQADGYMGGNARLLRLPNNRLSELEALLTYHSTAMGATLPRGGSIDLYA